MSDLALYTRQYNRQSLAYGRGRSSEQGGMKHDPRKLWTMARAAQSVLHQQMNDRTAADAWGYGIAEFCLSNWWTVSQDFGEDAADDIEVIERVTRYIMRKMPRM